MIDERKGGEDVCSGTWTLSLYSRREGPLTETAWSVGCGGDGGDLEKPCVLDAFTYERRERKVNSLLRLKPE